MKQQFKKLIALLALYCLLLASCGKDKPVSGDDPPVETTGVQEQIQGETPGDASMEPSETEAAEAMPWEEAGAKQPQEYTWEEYEALTTGQRKAFRKYLGTEGFAAWLELAEDTPEENPWDTPGAKQPKDYTWADYQALTEAQKKAFMAHLGPYGLEAWLKKVQNQEDKNPWEVSGAKQPGDYTWEEYKALTNKQQVAFAEFLGANGFQQWLEKVQGQKNQHPWEMPGAKQPRDYTWEEYEALTGTQKKAFRDFLGTYGFEAWLEKALKEEHPWEEAGAKQPQDYSWEEYEALTESQKKAFQEFLGADAFEAWLEVVLQQEGECPWEESGAKQPKDYIWADYEALTEAQQTAFREYLGEDAMKAWLRKLTDIPWEEKDAKQPEDYSLEEYEELEDPLQLAFRVWLGEEGFEEWLLEAESPEEEYPWDKPGAKKPQDYTWEEFSALTVNQQMAFQDYLGEAGFEAWLKKVQSQVSANPWEAPGAKQPEDYTWAEYEALTAEQQMAFQKYLGAEGFEAWLNKAQGQSTANPWEVPGAKQPQDYTWAEFEALTEAQQMAFQNYLGPDAFENWLSEVQNQTEKNPWEVPGAKQPQDYTWEEFEALTAGQQMAFQKYLGEEGFEAWLNRAQSQTEKNPWEVPGAKQPQDYTWEEFEALTAGQQMAFQKYLGEEAFDEWLNRVLAEANP